MWPRVVELLFGVWLWISAFVLRGTAGFDQFIVFDRIAGSGVIILSLLCWWRPTARAHLLTAVLAIALAGRAYAGWERPGPASAENDLLVGMLLLLFAIVPNRSNQPPEGWRHSAR